MTLKGSGYFSTSFNTIVNQWIHLVLNYIGPNNRQGIRLFEDGVRARSDSYLNSYNYTAGDGRVVVGKAYVDSAGYYASLEMDELIFFNKALMEAEVRELYNMYQWQ